MDGQHFTINTLLMHITLGSACIWYLYLIRTSSGHYPKANSIALQSSVSPSPTQRRTKKSFRTVTKIHHAHNWINIVKVSSWTRMIRLDANSAAVGNLADDFINLISSMRLTFDIMCSIRTIWSASNYSERITFPEGNAKENYDPFNYRAVELGMFDDLKDTITSEPFI